MKGHGTMKMNGRKLLTTGYLIFEMIPINYRPILITFWRYLHEGDWG